MAPARKIKINTNGLTQRKTANRTNIQAKFYLNNTSILLKGYLCQLHKQLQALNHGYVKLTTEYQAFLSRFTVSKLANGSS